MDSPEFIPNVEMEAIFGRKPGAGWLLLAIGERIYRREPDGWRRLDNRTHSTVEEMTRESA